MSGKMILLRHGESLWNDENRFTGWTDVALSDKGKQEALEAGKRLKNYGMRFEVAYTSVLQRAIQTLWILLEEMDLIWIPVFRSWRLNERHYGALQSLNKAELAQQEDPELVQQWRRSYDIRPPALDWDDPRHPRFDPRYADIPPESLPATESLADTLARVLPVWEREIAPRLLQGQDVLIVAHGNSLRALIKHIAEISDQKIRALVVPTGIPQVYEFDDEFTIHKSYYLY
jgi:2,3-bisphosphoglycerate-dependent phosphoglycerate mutase